MEASRYVVDPVDPRAPAQGVWDRMSAEERRRVVASLPSELPRTAPPEGDRHRIPRGQAFEALDEYFRRKGRSVYLSADLPVYYPDEKVFAPDLFAVLDVEAHERDRWVVSDERRGLDFVLEVHVAGHRRKDLVQNVERYARLGIPEYFVLSPTRRKLVGYALAEDSTYRPIVPQGGQWRSQVLGLQLAPEQGRLRFYIDGAPLPDARELVDRLTSMVDDAVRNAEEEARRVEEQARRAERLAAKLRELGVDPDDIE